MITKKTYSLYIEDEFETDISRTVFENILNIVFENEKVPVGTSVNLLLTDDETIKRMNKRFRGVAETTDVLSFPAEIPEISLLGDIIINVFQAKRQNSGNALPNELKKLFLHGLLHLLGYDHISVTQKRIMEEKEKKYRKILEKN